MAGLGQAMRDAVFDADAIEDVRIEKLPAWPSSVLGQSGAYHAVVGRDRMDLAGNRGHAVSENG
jgi:hypothetical protein